MGRSAHVRAVALILALLPGVAAAEGEPAGGAASQGGQSPAAAPAKAKGKKGTKAKASHPVATLPGFEMQADGSSRLFVEVTQQVEVQEKHAAGKLVYVLKGARVARRNNRNPLVTVHFNTPVVKAKLVPAGHDLDFVIHLRKDVTPTWKWAAMKDGAAMLQIDFPKGDYLPPPGASPAPAPPPADGPGEPQDPGGDGPSDG